MRFMCREKIDKTETVLVGSWILENEVMQNDHVAERIIWLINNILRKVADGNWCVLYEDPEDGRYWELSYPQSELQGGGPPKLENLSTSVARDKYGI
jgi:hypothetical protein